MAPRGLLNKHVPWPSNQSSFTSPPRLPRLGIAAVMIARNIGEGYAIDASTINRTWQELNFP